MRIFDRTNKVVKPTSAGEKIIRQARKVLMEASPHWARQSAFTAFDAVRMVEALSIATSLVGVELHRANAGAHLTFLSAIITDLNATVTIRKMSVLGATHEESVPIGQKEHQVRGAYMKASTTATIVVRRMMRQNTAPIAAQLPQA